jgi:cell division protein FtsQ
MFKKRIWKPLLDRISAGQLAWLALVVLMGFIEVKKAEMVCKACKGLYTGQPVFY